MSYKEDVAEVHEALLALVKSLSKEDRIKLKEALAKLKKCDAA